MREAIESMKNAFAILSNGEAVVPVRSHIEVTKHHGNLLLMPCYQPSADVLSLKTVTVFDGNPGIGLPRVQALVTLYDGSNGRTLAIMDGTTVTAIRTGAASGAATDLMARPDASVVGIFGAGAQARTQLEAVCTVRTIRKALVLDFNPETAKVFAEEMSAKLGIEVAVAADSKEAVIESDILCAATTSKTPVFSDADLKPGVHINGVGSYQPWVQEIPIETVLRSRVVVDHRESALAETGDLIIPIQQGRYSADHITAELGEIVIKRKIGRADPREITFFKSVGVAIQDLAAASYIYSKALQMNLGTLLQL